MQRTSWWRRKYEVLEGEQVPAMASARPFQWCLEIEYYLLITRLREARRRHHAG